MSCAPMPTTLVRGSALVLATGAVIAAAARLAWPVITRAVSSESPWRLPFDDLLAVVWALVLLAAAAWLGAVSGLLVVEAVTGATGRRLPCLVSRACDLVTPRLVRRLVLGVCGLAVTTTVTTTATTTVTTTATTTAAEGTAQASPGVDTHAPLPGRLSGLPVPDRAVGGLPTGSDGRPTCRVTVRPGDSLWALAAARLPGGASHADTDELWRLIYRLNTARLGPDPDRIYPGTVLRIPAAPSDRKETR